MSLHQIFHTFIAIYVCFGWILFPEIHAPACAAIVVHWLVNQNRCVFSDTYEDPNGFTTELLQKAGVDISKSEFLKSLVPYILVIIPGLISVYLAFRGYSFGPATIRTGLTYFLSAVPFIAVFRKLWVADVATDAAIMTDAVTDVVDPPTVESEVHQVASEVADSDRASP